VIQLSLARAKELLTEAVAEKGDDYVYTTPDGKQGTEEYQPVCLYVHGDRPGCIVGHALHKAGVTLAVLSYEERNDASGVLRSLRSADVLDCEDGVSQLFQDVQSLQDRGVPWGQAVQQSLAELDG
jgi:hypothetical protein